MGENLISMTLTVAGFLVPDRLVYMFLKLLISRDFPTQASLEFYCEWCRKTKKTSSEQQFCEQTRLVDERGQQRMAGLVGADRKAAVTQTDTFITVVSIKAPQSAQQVGP